jgi:hypothetical protein
MDRCSDAVNKPIDVHLLSWDGDRLSTGNDSDSELSKYWMNHARICNRLTRLAISGFLEEGMGQHFNLTIAK